MSIAYPDYLKIKNKYCVGYFGVFDEFILQLLHLRSAIEAAFPELELYIACKNELTLPGVVHNVNKYEYAHFRELTFNNINHPIFDFFKETEIKAPEISPAEKTNRCVILTKGIAPIISLSEAQVKKATNLAQLKGFNVEIDEDITGAGLVIGVECFNFYKAALKGIRCSLVPTGFGTEFFRMLVPNGEILSI